MTATYKLTETLPYLLYTVSNHLAENFSNELRAHKLTISMYRILAGLRERENLRLNELADMLLIETSTLSRLVAAMSARGLVSRRRQKDDERSLHINLTPAGRRLVEALIPRARHYETVAVEAVSTAGLASLKRSLVQILTQLRRAQAAQAMDAAKEKAPAKTRSPRRPRPARVLRASA